MHRLSFPVALALAPETAAACFPPTMRVVPSATADAGRMVPPPHSGARAAPERRGGTAAGQRRWAGVPHIGARSGGGR
jgi:hypothetical protein